MACRFPGGANDPAAFWKLLRDGVNAITEVPPERWNVDRFFHPVSGAPGRMISRWGGFVENVDHFDAAFFGIAPREASGIDPQQRWLLETTWEALEDAGLPPEQLAGSRTGVFIGISHSDYPMLQRRDLSGVDCYTNIGSALSIAANRLSYSLNFRGPSLAVDTACSSSLVALHLAAQSLASGESDYAVVGGANLVLTPEVNIGFSQAHMLSPRGRCRTFDADADGYVRSEGAATVLLMPLRKARALNLAVRAVVMATASNQDGHSSGLTVPNQEAQEAMIREALASAGARPSDVVYAEAHGTGTPVGDPIEARALAAVFSEGRSPSERLMIGSVKTNIGHLECASGLAGLIKAVLVLENRMIPPSLHFERPNPDLPLDQVQVAQVLTPLPGGNGRIPVVAVNSFGFGGTNAHVLLSPAPTNGSAPEPDVEPSIFPISARNAGALAAYANTFAQFIADSAPAAFSLKGLCAAAALGKSHHPMRRALVADSLVDLQTQLLALGKSTSESSSATRAQLKIAFVFCGQGPQWWAMGRQLYRREKVIRDFWERCDETCQKLGGPPLLEALLSDETSSRLDHTDIAQPALFALQASLVELWRHWGVVPDMVLGHSVGEAAAAWAAGVFDLNQIFRVILVRSRWQAKAHGLGRMLAAGISADDAQVLVRKSAGRISLAAVNAPRQVTLSGAAAVLEEIAKSLKEGEIFGRFLQTEYAFHSAQMDFMEDGLRRELGGLAPAEARLSMISTVSGEPVLGPELSADYWWRNVREPVRFAEGISRLLRDGCTALVEIGPHPVMAAALAEIILAEKSSASSVPSLRRAEDERSTMLHGLAALYRQGVPVRWEALYTRPTSAIRLPAYPWQRQRFWREYDGAPRELRSAPPHPLLGDRQPHPQPTWLGQLDLRLVPWLADHRIAGSLVVPAAAYIEMAAAAVREFLNEPTIFLENITFHHLLFLTDERPVPTCVRLDPIASSFQILSRKPDGVNEWELQAEGFYRPGRLHVPPPADPEVLREEFPNICDPQEHYRKLSEMGQVYGPAFQGMQTLRLRADEAVFCEIAAPGGRDSSDYLVYPPALDSCFHSAIVLLLRPDSGAFIILTVGQVRIFQPLPDVAWSYVRLIERGGNSNVGDLTVYDRNGTVVAEVDKVKLRPIDSESRSGQRERKFYSFGWEPMPAPTAKPPDEAAGPVLIFADGGKFGARLAQSLSAQSIATTLVCRDSMGGSDDDTGTVLTVNLRQQDWAVRFWEALAARGPLPRRIIYLWNWDDDEDGCARFLALVQGRLAAPGAEDEARWLVVTHGAQAVREDESLTPAPAALWGFVRSLQTEQPQWRVSLADCASESAGESLLRELFCVEREPEVAFREDGRWVRRLRLFQPRSAPRGSHPPAYSLHLGQSGRVDSLQFLGRPRLVPEAGEVEIEVAAAGLNFRDLMKTLGIYPLGEGEPMRLGDEFAGRVARVGRGIRGLKIGDRAMGFAPSGGAFASHLVQRADAVWKIPSHLSFADAASIPVVFGTAFHALHTLARLRRGESVLIHAAAGGVGLAAVQLALKIGAVVFATAGSEEKRAMLHTLGVSRVMDSRTLDFAGETLLATGGRGVDVVLNSLAGAFQQKSLAVCAPHGRFVEIGKRDLFENGVLPLAAFQRSLSFFAFDLTSVFATSGVESRALRRFLATGFSKGKYQPIPCSRFPATDAVTAFRQMQAAQHIGKIVLEFDPQHAPEVPAEFWPSPEGTYLVSGGLGGFGLATAGWLADRGAMHLALLSRRGKPSAKDAPLLTALRGRGVSVNTMAVDVADAKALAEALRKLEDKAPPLRGVFHSAMVLRDGPISTMTQQNLAEVLAPKLKGAWNLHQLTRDLPLDCFVMYSSISSIIGPPGHANYAAANTFLDALAHLRRAAGLPGLSINWGQLAEVGVAAENPEISRYLEAIGVLAVSSRNALAALPRLIASQEAQVGVMEVDWDRLGRASAKNSESPVFRDLAQSGRASAVAGGSAGEWRELVRNMPTEEQARAVSLLVVAQVAATLRMAPEEIDPHGPLIGMDSLMAVELKVRLEDHAGCTLPLDALNAGVTATRLAERLLKQMQTTTVEARPAPLRPPPATHDGRAELSSPLLSTQPAPLLELMRAGKLAPLAAGALMPWPITLFQQTGVAPEEFFARLHRGGSPVSLDIILETPLGFVGIFMLPLTTSQVQPGETSLLPLAMEGIRHATACGAKCVALTGLIPSATSYGAVVQAACDAEGHLAAVTTGHATTVAAVLLNLVALLGEAGRRLEDETVMFYGIGSIGLGSLRLMLDVLPHPAELRLCDPFRSASYFAELELILRREYHFEGPIRVVGSTGNRAADFYDASVIVGATNAEDVLDVSRLAPGTLVVDDSSPHCLNGPAALARFTARRDILFTEGGFVRGGTAMPRVFHIPPSAAPGVEVKIPELFFSMLRSEDITGCVLSALLSARHPELAPTIGQVEPATVRQHWQMLAELEFTAAKLNYEGIYLDPNAVARFRAEFGKVAATV